MRLAEGLPGAAKARFTEASMIYRKSIGVVGWLCRGVQALAYGWGWHAEASGKAAGVSGLSAGDRLVSDFFKAH
jgi:hypothetical protein